jgi:hypothetical protein
MADDVTFRLQEETQMGMYDVIIHNGDFAYDMNDVSMYVCMYAHVSTVNFNLNMLYVYKHK